MTRPCSDCGKPIDGKSKSYCRACINTRNKAYRAVKPEQYLAKEKEWRERNREVIRERNREWAKNNPRPRRTTPEKDWAQALKRKYGLTVEQFDQMWSEQEGKCAICKSEMEPPQFGRGRGGPARGVVVDHDHETDEVRGLLCRLCNVGLGSLGDSLTTLQSAVAYLEKYESPDK